MKKISKLLQAISLLSCALLLTKLNAATTPPNATDNSQILASRLGWVSVMQPTNVCGGYYVEPALLTPGQPILPLNQSQTNITFDNATYYQNQPSVLTGNVVVVQSGRRLVADKAVLFRDPKTGNLIAVDLSGNVQVIEPGRLILGDKAHIQLNNKGGTIQDVTYRVLLVSDQEVAAYEQALANSELKFTTTTAWGKAQEAVQSAPGNMEFTQATYTTCAPTVNQWRLNASKLKLNRATGRGVARNVTITVDDFPIFYTPYLNFPINKKRKTGFLFPELGHSNISGFNFGLPFYWNIAPNYDATITPQFYSKRGVLTEGLFRYLTTNSVGEINGSFIPNDKAFKQFQSTASATYAGQPAINNFGLNDLLNASDNRYAFNLNNATQFNQQWAASLNYSTVSDDYFYQDFGSAPAELTTNQLLQQATIDYTGTNWNFSGMLQGYDTLHPVNRVPLDNLYSRLPELDFNGSYPNFYGDLGFTMQNQAVYFTRSMGPGDLTTPPLAGRYNTQPGINLAIYKPYGYLIPTLQLAATGYNIQNQIPNEPANISRALPIFDVDSGLYFDRNVTIGGNDYDQTLEPRLYYLYVPYNNQNNIPIFDTAVTPFTYSQLFQTNRFSGTDRIGDANQISLGLTTRFIDQTTGTEKFHLSIGQIYYFENRRVTVCNTPDCTDFGTGLGATANTSYSSPIAGQVSYHFIPTLSANGDMAWDPHERQFDTGDFYFQYAPDGQHLLNFGYNFLRNGDIIPNVPVGSSQNNLNLGTVSFAFPISDAWSTVGIWTYDISQQHSQSYLGGLEYNTCCWAARILGGRTFTALNQNGTPTYTNGVYIQWELKGLANFDPMNTSSLLTSQIPGYVDPFASMPGLT